jgi:hypothetical protein
MASTHVKAEPGKFSTDSAHVHDHKRGFIEPEAPWMRKAGWKLLEAGAPVECVHGCSFSL